LPSSNLIATNKATHIHIPLYYSPWISNSPTWVPNSVKQSWCRRNKRPINESCKICCKKWSRLVLASVLEHRYVA
jgi:hypothetical protein